MADRFRSQSTNRRKRCLNNKTGELLTTQENLDPRVKRTRRLIEGAFLELLSEKTLHAMTVSDITERAEINRATFYGHFFDKYALFSHIVRKTFLQTLSEYLPPDAPYNRDNLKALVIAVCHYFVYLNSQCPPSDRQLRPVAETEVQAVVYEQLCRWFQESAEVDRAELTATYISWAIFGVGLARIGNQPTQAIDDTAAAIFVLVEKTLT